MLVLLVAAAVVLAGCGSSSTSSGSGTGQTSGASGGKPSGAKGITLTPGGGRGATHPPVATRTVPALIAPSNSPAKSVHVPVLTYHRVAPLSAVGLTDLKVEPSNFLAELAALQTGGYHAISQAQLFDALYKGGKLPPKSVMISVDDGYIDDITRILPALQRFHMVATFFVITGRTTEPGFLTADQIRQLDQAGMDVGDHTAHHVDLRLLTAAQLRTETAGSKQVLEHVLGHPVYYFAYPFGAYNNTVVNAVRAAGFTLAYSTAGGTTESTSAPLTMPRVHVGRAETPGGLVSLLGGA
jgi:peptidoglycan/xylan/chitin deacetylase (PgdA/CDA1 family)